MHTKNSKSQIHQSHPSAAGLELVVQGRGAKVPGTHDGQGSPSSARNRRQIHDLVDRQTTSPGTV